MTSEPYLTFRGLILSMIPVGLLLVGCGSSPGGKADGGSGGRASATGGAGTGGISATGGNAVGGTTGTGGAGAGGAMATGGSGTGGTTETGGSAGGATGTGGGVGGAIATGGATGTGGGGMGGVGTGGNAAGGAPGTGGGAGAAGMGGTGMGGAAGSTCMSIKINEVLVATSISADEEFIELYNPCSTAVDLAGYRVVYRAVTTLLDTNVVTFTNQTIAAGEFLVIGSYPAGGQRDLPFALTVHLAAAGGVGIRNAANTLLDAVGFAPTGTLVNNGLVEGLATIAPGAGQSIVRRPDGDDSNTNAGDFAVSFIPSPGVTNN